MGWVTTYDLRVERCPRARSIGMRRTEDAMAQRVDQPPRSRLASLPLFYRVISGQRSYRARAQSLPRAGVVSPLPTPLFPVPHSLSLLSASIPLPPAPTLGGRRLFPLSLAVRVVLQSSTCWKELHRVPEVVWPKAAHHHHTLPPSDVG